MKSFLTTLFIFIALSMCISCKKAVQQQEQNIIVQAVTTGHWYVQQYIDTTVDVTADFSGYEFQFYQNGNVDAILGSVTKSSGTWSSDMTNYTISANFPANASDTLKRLNYTWKITDSYLDYVEAKASTLNGNNILHLRKK